MKYTFYICILALVALVASCDYGTSSEYKSYNPDIPLPSMNLSGKGGSMARFTIVDSSLYVLTNEQLQAFNISNPSNPILRSTEGMWGMETVFAFDSLLFLGSQNGMSVYNISNPYEPVYVSYYEHITACDPVVFDGKYAYVTLNSSSEICGRWVNELHVINMENLAYPFMETVYPMSSPKGLGVDGDLLFVCDGNELVVYDKKDPFNFVTQARFDAKGAYDVIPNNGNLILTSAAGIFQYSYNTSSKTISLQSSILVNNKK